jgi:plastocyanin
MTGDGAGRNGARRWRDDAQGVRNTIIVLAVVLAALVVVLRLRTHHSAPVHLVGKVDYHGTRTVRDGTTVKVLLEDTSFSPTFMYVTPGSHFSILLHDQGFHAHNFTVPELGIDVTLAPNTSMTIPVDIPSTSVIPFECRFHKPNGMQGAFVVKPST